MNDKEKAVAAYREAYKKYASVSIEQEEAAIELKSASRAALDLGVPLQDLRSVRFEVDNHAEFMTDWK